MRCKVCDSAPPKKIQNIPPRARRRMNEARLPSFLATAPRRRQHPRPPAGTPHARTGATQTPTAAYAAHRRQTASATTATATMMLTTNAGADGRTEAAAASKQAGVCHTQPPKRACCCWPGFTIRAQFLKQGSSCRNGGVGQGSPGPCGSQRQQQQRHKRVCATKCCRASPSVEGGWVCAARGLERHPLNCAALPHQHSIKRVHRPHT